MLMIIMNATEPFFNCPAQVEVHGLDGTKFIDKCDALKIKTQVGMRERERERERER
jgi:hypothetical protein